MFAFAVRLRRKDGAEKPPPPPDPVTSDSGKLFILGFLLVFFGGIFLFFELYGKCHCKMDFIGYAMISLGSLLIGLKCVGGLVEGFREDRQERWDKEDLENGNQNNQNKAKGKTRSNSQIVAAINLKNNNGEIGVFNLNRPIMISRELSPDNCDLQLIGKQTIRVINCHDKIDPSCLKLSYNLPAVVVDA